MYVNYFRSPAPYLVILLLLCVIIWLYWPGINGGFLFDDFANLNLLGRLRIQDDFWVGVVSYLDSGWAGPTKRPIAMASFLLEYSSWPYDPEPFKRNNILFHLITSLLVFWFALSLAKHCQMKASQQPWFAILAMGLFALHPYQVSTTLYVIQRMTILAALFSLAALIFYLKGTARLAQANRCGWWLILVMYPLCTLLAIFSKESGVLIAFFTAIIAFVFGRGLSDSVGQGPSVWERRLHWWVTYGPAMLLALAMLVHFGMTMVNDPELRRREFTVIERLLTESRVVWNYLYDIFVPKIQTAGLYHDNYVISKNLVTPITTLLSIVGLLIAVALAMVKLSVWPFLAFSILGYLAGHALESTYVGLEIYFEHRNYMPVVFIFLGAAWLIIRLADTRRGMAIGVALMLMLGFTAIAYQRVQLWSNPSMLILVWAEMSRGSERALLDAANQLQVVGDIPKAVSYVDKAMANNPSNPRPVLYALAMQCRYGDILPDATVERARRLLKSYVYHQATYNHLKLIRELKEGGACGTLTMEQIRTLVVATFDNDAISSGNIRALEYFELGNLALLEQNPDQAVEHYRHAISLRGDTQVGLVEIARLASAGYPSLALSHLSDVREHNTRRYSQAISTSDIREFRWVDTELSRLEAMLLKEQSKLSELANE